MSEIFAVQDYSYIGNESNFFGIVKRHLIDKAVKFPCILLKDDTYKKGAMELLKGLLVKAVNVNESQDYLYVYLIMENDILNIGRISKKGLKALLTVKSFDSMKKRAYLSADYYLDDSYIFALTSL